MVHVEIATMILIIEATAPIETGVDLAGVRDRLQRKEDAEQYQGCRCDPEIVT